MGCNPRYFIVCLIMMILCPYTFLSGQDCKLPLLSAFESPSTSGFAIEWLDFNSGNVTWEIEYGIKGFSPTGVATIQNISSDQYTLDGLESGTTYEVYIRAICNDGPSEWNGPYFTNTVIDNENGCGLDLDISDDNCPSDDVFLIEVTGFPGMTMGVDVFLEKVELIAKHPWPADLRIRLESPYGISIPLSTNNGRGVDNYGDPKILDCSEPVVFTDNACSSIAIAEPPFIGSFQSEGVLASLYSSNSPDGQWKISICDRAGGDIGSLIYVYLSFEEVSCTVPPTFKIIDEEADNITVSWQDQNSCTALELVYNKVGEPSQNASSEYVECDKETFTILDLEPGEAYELVVRADCGAGNFSPESCVELFTTACNNSSIAERFDNQSLCEQSCASPCELSGVWHNAVDNSSFWILNEGDTPTSFTGPEGDVNETGRYLYVENQNPICEGEQLISLESDCLRKSESGACALTFAYHMSGSEIGTLGVDISLDGSNWNSLWQQDGDQGDSWLSASVDIPFAFERGLLRITALKMRGAIRGDIAIDQIKLIGVDTIVPNRFYRDADGDGFGDPSSTMHFCSETIPSGYASNNLDCNDESASVFPGAVEIRCNQIDENCNGDQDDASLQDLDYEVLTVQEESCLGAANGLIVIEGLNGQEPYEYVWSDGSIGPGVTDLVSGIYFCTISDVGGCQIVSDPIFVDFEDILVYSVLALEQPSCAGDDDGMIQLRIEGGVPPYQVVWSNGMLGSTAQGLADGNYQATITDMSSCSVVIDSIPIRGPQILTTGIFSLENNDCKGNSDGFVRLGILGGTPPFDIAWSNGESGIIVSGLSTGNYEVTVTDDNGCRDLIQDITISEPDSLILSVNNIEHITCPEGDDSLVDINITGGTPPYSYFWSNGENTQDLVGVPSGLYALTVTDIRSCSYVLDNVIVEEPETISIQLDSLVNVDCIGSGDGFLSVNVAGGSGEYSYNWGTTDGEESDENFLDELTAGIYSLTVVDDFDCKSRAFSVEVINRNVPIQVSVNQYETLSCADDSTASIIANIGTAVLPLDYNWSSGNRAIHAAYQDTVAGLISGSYDLTVTDAQGCVGISDSIQIMGPTAIRHELLDKVDNLCWYDSLGIIHLDIQGGQVPYNVEWQDGRTGQLIEELPNGSYTARIIDDNGCEKVLDEIFVSSNSPIHFNPEIIHPMEGVGGEIDLMPSGSAPPYVFRWADPLQFLNDGFAADLAAGSYSVTVEDSDGCISDTTIILTRMTSASSLEASNFSLYPNPTNGQLYMTTDWIGNRVGCKVYDFQGSVVMQTKLNSSGSLQNRYQLDLSILPDGVYFIHLTNKGMNQVSKVFKFN